MIVKAWNKEYNVHIKKSTYASNNNLAIQLVEDDGAPFAMLPVNIDKLPCGYAYLDTNNCPWAVDFVKDNNLGEFAGSHTVSGFYAYPLFRFYEEVYNNDNKGIDRGNI